jgi:hypothetical protein
VLIATFLAAGLSIAGLSLSTKNLEGEPRVFPADVGPRRAVIVVTFAKAAADQASEWTRKLRENQHALAGSIYQIAIIDDVPALFRSLVIAGLRRGIPKELHDHFWVASSASKQWQDCIGAKALDQAHVFVLEDRSQITWRFHGVFSEATLRSLLAACSAQKN